MSALEHLRLAVALTPARALAWFVGLIGFLVFAASVLGCCIPATELHDCTLALDEAPPNGRLVCAGRTIPVRRIAPWLWDAAKARK